MSELQDEPTIPTAFDYKLLTAQEVADALGLRVKTVYDLAAKGIIPRVKIGSLVRFNSKQLAAWIESGGTQRNNEQKSDGSE